jgi:hypothetical protein
VPGSTWVFEGWVYSGRDGKLVGPVTGDQLKQAISNGDVQPADRVWTRWRNGNVILIPTLARQVYDPPQAPY